MLESVVLKIKYKIHFIHLEQVWPRHLLSSGLCASFNALTLLGDRKDVWLILILKHYPAE